MGFMLRMIKKLQLLNPKAEIKSTKLIFGVS
jgi:hypothetical protein